MAKDEKNTPTKGFYKDYSVKNTKQMRGFYLTYLKTETVFRFSGESNFLNTVNRILNNRPQGFLKPLWSNDITNNIKFENSPMYNMSSYHSHQKQLTIINTINKF